MTSKNAKREFDRHLVYDAAARFNETVISNLDAIDTALRAVLAGNVAIVVFAIDKIAELRPRTELCALALLAGSILGCTVGYSVGFSPRVSNRDGIRSRSFVADFSVRPDEAIFGAVEDLVESAEINLTVRLLERTLAVGAIMLLLAGVAVVALARLRGEVVH